MRLKECGPVKRVTRLLEDPTTMRRFHGWAAIFWFVAAFPIMVWLSRSVQFLVFISVYAVVTGHWGSNQAAAAEIKADPDIVNSDAECGSGSCAAD